MARALQPAAFHYVHDLECAIIVSSFAPNGESNRSLEPPGKRNRFPRRLRLLRHADFERVYKSGRRHFSASLTAFYLSRTGAQPAGVKTSGVKESGAKASGAKASGLRIGFTVGRALGGAVQRNRIKRRLREAVRLSRPPAETSADVVINPKKSVLTADFETLLNEVRRAFVIIEEKLAKEEKTAKQRRE